MRMRQYRQHSEEDEVKSPALTGRARDGYIMVSVLLLRAAPGESEAERCGSEVMPAPVLLGV
jgi:hypothetical protein